MLLYHIKMKKHSISYMTSVDASNNPEKFRYIISTSTKMTLGSKHYDFNQLDIKKKIDSFFYYIVMTMTMALTMPMIRSMILAITMTKFLVR